MVNNVNAGAIKTRERNHTSKPSPSASRELSQFLVVLVLAGLTAIIVLERLYTYNEPLELDVTLYAVI